MIGLSELENDALAEFANIGVARASVALSKMIRGEVMMTVPVIEVLSHEAAARKLNMEFSERLVAVSEPFSGALNGSAMLVFPEKNSLELVRAAMPEEVDLDNVFELEQEALSEIGNVILNSCLSAIANILATSIRTALPMVLYGNGLEIFQNSGAEAGADATAIVFYIKFQVKDRDIVGQIVIAMGVSSAATLKGLIGDYIARVVA